MTFQTLLKREFDKRRTRNPRYSLRAFASAIHVDHSTLSQIIRGKRPLTRRSVQRLGVALKLQGWEIERYGPLPDTEVRIMELVARGRCRMDSRWLAAQLAVTTDEFNVALQRLLRLRLLTMVSTTTWILDEEMKWETR